MALFAATQLAVVDLANGQKIASYEWKTRDNANCADPVIVGDAIFVTSGYGVGCALIGVSGGNAAVLWKKEFACHYASPVLVGDCLYALFGSGWLKADLVCVSVKGRLGPMDAEGCGKRRPHGCGREVARPVPRRRFDSGGGVSHRLHRIARAKIFSAGACWNGPVLCDGRIYARNEKGTLVCLDVRGK